MIMRKVLMASVAVLAATSLASAVTLTVEPLVLQPGEVGTLNVVLSDTGGQSFGLIQTLLIIGAPADLGMGSDTSPPLPAFVGGNLGSAWAGSGAVNQYFNLDVGTGPLALSAGNIGLPNAATPLTATGQLFTFQVQALEALSVPVTVSINLDNTIVQNAAGAPVAFTVVDGSVTVVPEPAAALLLGLGGLFLRRRHA